MRPAKFNDAALPVLLDTHVLVWLADAQGEASGRWAGDLAHWGRITQTQCVIGPLSEPLIGQFVPEAVDVVADCTNRTLNAERPTICC